jgi:hypothetical protein
MLSAKQLEMGCLVGVTEDEDEERKDDLASS